MRFAVIGPTYPYKGGISHFTTLLVENLRKRFFVEFISWKRQYPSFLYPVELKDTKSKHPIKTEAKFILDFYNPFSWLHAVLLTRKNHVDILALTWASPIQAPIYIVLSLLIKAISRTKILYICHNVLPHENAFYDKPLIKMAFGLADYFIVHSSEDGEILNGIVKNKKIVKGFLPLYDIFPQQESYDREKIKKDLKLKKRVLLFFGYIRPYKGLKYLLEAMPSILKDFPETSLLVVGEFWSKDKSEYLKLEKDLEIDRDVIHIDNYVPNEELGKYFAVSDVVVLPYVTATQSASIQTAYGFNKPVISTTVGGLKDVMEDGKTGYIIKPENSEDIVEKVKKFYRSSWSSRGLEKHRTQFNWNAYTQLIESTVK